mgnify:CR=1 FL=1
MYTDWLKRPLGAVSDHLCTLLRRCGQTWGRRSVHRLAKTASRRRFGAFVYTVAPRGSCELRCELRRALCRVARVAQTPWYAGGAPRWLPPPCREGRLCASAAASLASSSRQQPMQTPNPRGAVCILPKSGGPGAASGRVPALRGPAVRPAARAFPGVSRRPQGKVTSPITGCRGLCRPYCSACRVNLISPRSRRRRRSALRQGSPKGRRMTSAAGKWIGSPRAGRNATPGPVGTRPRPTTPRPGRGGPSASTWPRGSG